jgi:hypothetical protein
MHISIPELLSDERSLGVFFLVTVLMGGAAAWLAGRAVAASWRPWWHVVMFMLILGLAVRFIHFAVFGSKLLSLHYYLVDAGVCLGAGLVGFRWMRARQMVASYSWINERAGPFGWRRRVNPSTVANSESG